MSRLTRLLAPMTLGLTLGATPLYALDLGAMSAAEKTAFGAAVRSYLLENPDVLMEAIGVLEERSESAQATAEQDFLRDNAAEIYTNPADWVGGNLSGDVTVVEFIDYRCGYCRKAWSDVEELVKTDGNIRIVMKEFPILGEDSVASSQFAIAARKLGGDEAYKAAHDALIQLQGPANEAALAALAADLKLNFADLQAEMASADTAAILNANQQLASALQINGTPTFIVDQAMVRGFVPLEGMRQIVAEARKAD